MSNFDDLIQVVPLLGRAEVPVELHPPDSSELKSTVLDHLGTLERTGYYVTFQRLYEVHGQWASPHRDDASLLAIKMTPVTKNPKNHFKRLKVTMALELSKTAQGNPIQPHFASFEPGLEGAWFMKEVSHTLTTTKEAEGNLGVQLPGAVNMGTKFTGSKTEEMQRRAIHTIKAEPSGWDTVSLKASRVTWTLMPAEDSDGIGDHIVVAMLVRRHRASKFLIRVQSEADINFLKDSTNTLLTWGHHVKLGEFGPASAIDQLIPDGVEATNLQQAADHDLLRNVAFVHVPEKVSPRSVYTINKTASVSNDGGLGETVAKTVTASIMSSTATGNQTPGAEMARPVAICSTTAHQALLERTDKPGRTSDAAAVAPQLLAPVAGNMYQRANIRALRHRRMAALYRRLAQLHMEEADDADGVPSMESYAREAEREEFA